MKKIFTIRILYALILLSVVPWYADSLEVPPLTGPVNDRAEILSTSARSQIENYLASIERANGAQIALLTIPSLEGDSIESYSIRVTKKWALGQKNKDNGVLFLLAKAEKKMRIEVGYGLEGILTDVMSGYIIRNVIVPQLKKGNFDLGIAKGLQTIGGIITGEVKISSEQLQKKQSDNLPVSLFAILFILFYLLSSMGGYRRHRRRGISPGTALFMGMLMGGAAGRHRGSGFSGGGFSSGGFSGGGGGFGGGGASGGW